MLVLRELLCGLENLQSMKLYAFEKPSGLYIFRMKALKLFRGGLVG